MKNNLSNKDKKHIRLLLIPAFMIGVLVVIALIYFSFQLTSWGLIELFNSIPFLTGFNISISLVSDVFAFTLIAISLFTSRHKILGHIERYWSMALGNAEFTVTTSKE